MVLETIDDTDRQFLKISIDSSPQKKSVQTIKDSFESILINSKRKPNIIESDRDEEFYNNIFQDFLNKNNIKLYSRNSS